MQIFGIKDGAGGAVVMYDAANKTAYQLAIKAQGVSLFDHQEYATADLEAEQRADMQALMGELPAVVAQDGLSGSGAVHLDRLAKNGLVQIISPRS